MNTGQMLITIGALMLLSVVILRVNNNFLNTSALMMETKQGVLAVSLGTSILEDATGKAFDQNTDTAAVTLTSQLSTLGPDNGEDHMDKFNDFDDYDGLFIVDSTLPSAHFIIMCEVDYIVDGSPETVTTSKTWNKRLTVRVTTDQTGAFQDTVVLSTIYSYFYFR